MILKLVVEAQNIYPYQGENMVASDSVEFVQVEFLFSSEWDGLIKTAQFTQGENTYNVLMGSDIINLPVEIESGYVNISVFGIQQGGVVRATTIPYRQAVKKSGYTIDGQDAIEPTPSIYQQWADLVTGTLDTIEQIQTSMNLQVGEVVENVVVTTQKAEDSAQSASQAEISETNAKASEQNAKISEDNAKLSEDNSKISETTAAQALADLLAMLGTDVATLVGGKLNPSQIPALSINDTFKVPDIDAMLLLTAQRGDVALIVVDDVVSESYILAADDPTTLDNWTKLGVSYVANAGHSVTADNATDATMINGHRVVVMTQAQYDAAVKDPGTVYLVSGV